MESKTSKYSLLSVALWCSLGIYIIVDLFGEVIGSLGSNYECIKYIGCTSGFFGYDAIEHFLCGLTFALLLAWICRKFPSYSILTDKRWKNALIIISVVALVAVCWEFLECAHDVFRLDILHQPLFNLKLHINLLDQPTNLDTMGDLAFNVFGSIVALFVALRKEKGL